jgi:hypothetical protein
MENGDLFVESGPENSKRSYGGVPLERVIENTHYIAFPYQFGLFNDPF